QFSRFGPSRQQWQRQVRHQRRRRPLGQPRHEAQRLHLEAQAQIGAGQLRGRGLDQARADHVELYQRPVVRSGLTVASVALLSNPRSTGNRSLLPRVREYCAAHPDIFHYEVEAVDQIGEAIRTIAMVSPRVIAINGGDGTVQAALTELYSG